MTEEEFQEFAKQVEADLIAHDPAWAEYPFGTEQGLLDQYSQTFDGVGTIFYYTVFTNPTTNEAIRNTQLLDMSRDDIVDPGDGIPLIPEPTPPTASDIVYYGHEAPETPALSPIWFDTSTGDIRIWYSFEGSTTWINTGVAGVGKIEFLNDLQDVDVLTNAPADNNFLKFDSSAPNIWKPFDLYGYMDGRYSLNTHVHTLDSLSNTTIATPEANQILAYDGANWINKSTSSVEVWYGDSPPTDTSRYPIWFDTTTAFTAIHYDDGNSQQWINIGGSDSRVSSVQAHSALSKTITYTINIPLVWTKMLFTISSTGTFDTDSNFNSVTNTYTCPVDGIYTFSTNVRLDQLSTAGYTYVTLRKDDLGHIYGIEGNNESTNYMNIGFSVQLSCLAGEEYNIWLYEDNDASFKVNAQSYFSITLEHEL